MTELMVGLTVFVVVVLAAGSVQQRLAINASSVRLQQRLMEYMNGEVVNLYKTAQIPDRFTDPLSGNTTLKYDAVTGQLIPYGYQTTINATLNPDMFASSGKVVTYPDELASQSSSEMDIERVQVRRTMTVTTSNANADDEYKTVTITLTDVQSKTRFQPITKSITIKRPHPASLDTRMATGLADLSGFVVNGLSKVPVVPSTAVAITLTPIDGSPARTTSPDNTGRFYFAPPLKTNVNYTIKFEYPEKYWITTLPTFPMKPGSNQVAGNSGSTVYLPPRLFGQVNVSVVDIENNMPLPGASVTIYHPSPVPNGKIQSYSGTTDIGGNCSFNIEIPTPDSTTYNNSATKKYYVYYVTKTGYVRQYPNQYVTLDIYSPVNKTVKLFPLKTGNLNITVYNTQHQPNTKATVAVCTDVNYTSVLATRNTDNYGRATFTNLEVNVYNAPEQTSRTLYVRATSANHLLEKSIPTTVITPNNTTEYTVQMKPHKLELALASALTLRSIQIGFPETITGTVMYEGHFGPTKKTDIVRGPNITASPNPLSFLGETITSGGVPGQFTWAVLDNTIAQLTEPSGADVTAADKIDKQVVNCLAVGVTTVNVSATYSHSWNYIPYSLPINFSFPIKCVETVNNLTLAITPKPLYTPPNTPVTLLAKVENAPSDLTFTWDVTGDGLVDATMLDASENIASNGTTQAVKCRITPSFILKSAIFVEVKVYSNTLHDGRTALHNFIVDFAPFDLTTEPTGSIATQPGFSLVIKANPSGGSGTYEYDWGLYESVSPLVEDTHGIGTLSDASTPSVVFSASQVGQVAVVITVKDLVTSAKKSGVISIDSQPPGGVVK